MPGYELTVSEIIEETSDARSVVFTVPDQARGKFSYRPGQFLTVRVPSERTGSVARCYSLSSCPDTDGALKVTVKRVADGYGSNWICDNLRTGSTVEVLRPAGVFTPASLDADLLLFAGGSGVTPVMSILKSALTRGTGRIVLVYANRDENSVIFARELRELSTAHPERLTVIHWLESVQGLPDVTALRTLARPYASYDSFICGPAPFMDAVSQALKQLGLPRERIHVERFLSLDENPFEAVESPVAESDQDDATVTVELDGQTHEISWQRNKPLLDVLLDKGLDAPFSCRQGACSACACRIVSGDVKMLRNEILEQEDLDEGIFLACQAQPITDEVHVSYE